MPIVRVDPHTHLYDHYPLERWCNAAIANLQVSSVTQGVLIVVDREGQDSFKRLRRELGPDNLVEEASAESGEMPLAAQITVGSLQLCVVRGVQYVSSEKLEVLGLGVARFCADGVPCRELIQRIRDHAGVAYMPWSPGKWFGKRGAVIVGLLNEFRPNQIVFGDIALRARGLPPSVLLRRAEKMGFGVIAGSDPLPREADASLVGSYGLQVDFPEELHLQTIRGKVVTAISSNFNNLKAWGRPNSLLSAASRFISTF
jgi:hypothetical protein